MTKLRGLRHLEGARKDICGTFISEGARHLSCDFILTNINGAIITWTGSYKAILL